LSASLGLEFLWDDETSFYDDALLPQLLPTLLQQWPNDTPSRAVPELSGLNLRRPAIEVTDAFSQSLDINSINFK
jgi:hypothetical protein